MISAFTGAYRFLSNFYPCQVECDGERYPSVEHAYQAAKTRDRSWQRQIQAAWTAAEAKRLGRLAPLRGDWGDESIRLRIMRDLLVQKFTDPVLRERLRQTDPEELVEGNTWGDRFWGECPVGTGKNWLGVLLMNIRDGGC